MKGWILKILIVLNSLYFLIGCFLVYKWYYAGFWLEGVIKGLFFPSEFKTLTKAYQQFFSHSALIEEFGIISYVVAFVLVASGLICKIATRWIFLALLPLTTALVIILYSVYY